MYWSPEFVSWNKNVFGQKKGYDHRADARVLSQEHDPAHGSPATSRFSRPGDPSKDAERGDRHANY